MGRRSREKGARGEREAAEELGRVLGLDAGAAHRGRQYHGGPDSPDVVLTGVNIHVEAKRVEALSLYPALHQAAQDAPRGKTPVVWHRRNKHRSVVIVETSNLVALAREIVRVVDGGASEQATAAVAEDPTGTAWLRVGSPAKCEQRRPPRAAQK